MSYYMSRTQFPSLTNRSNSNLMSICSFTAYKVPCQAVCHLMPMALFEEDDSLDFTYEEMQSSESGQGYIHRARWNWSKLTVINSFPRVL